MEPFIGQIMLFGFNFTPYGWAICDGRLLPISENEALFALIGTTYGGDGMTTFGLPDLRGRIPICMGWGAGLSSYDLGEMGGTEQVTLVLPQAPAHSHMLEVAANPSSSTQVPGPSAVFAASKGPNLYGQAGSPASTLGACIDAAGGSQPHENMMPTLVANYCIALQGIFPSRN